MLPLEVDELSGCVGLSDNHRIMEKKMETIGMVGIVLGLYRDYREYIGFTSGLWGLYRGYREYMGGYVPLFCILLLEMSLFERRTNKNPNV